VTWRLRLRMLWWCAQCGLVDFCNDVNDFLFGGGKAVERVCRLMKKDCRHWIIIDGKSTQCKKHHEKANGSDQ